MKRNARKTRRARRAASELDQYTPIARLALIAGDSLALNDEQLTEAMNALSGFEEPDELADVLHARLLEMVELLSDLPEFAGIEIGRTRQTLEQRRGAGFVQRVSALGTPAAAALSSYKIQGVNSRVFLARARAVLKYVAWLGISTRVGWLRRCTGGARRRSSSGRRSAFTSSARRASRRRSSSGSISRRSTRARSSARGNQSTPSDGPPAPSSDRRTHPSRRRRRCASCTADTVSAGSSLLSTTGKG